MCREILFKMKLWYSKVKLNLLDIYNVLSIYYKSLDNYDRYIFKESNDLYSLKNYLTVKIYFKKIAFGIITLATRENVATWATTALNVYTFRI